MQLETLRSTVLGKIVADKADWIAARKLHQPLTDFQADLEPSDRDFVAALRQQHPAFILECKKASPSKGLIRDDFDPEAIAGIYGRHASAISVLTDEKYFQGDFAFLPRVRSQVRVPVLCKDFVIDPYQIYLARHYQADAVLLMLSVLDDEEYRQLAAVAESLKMGVLTEVSTETELERAIELGAQVIGINNRNLRDLSIDPERTKRLAPHIPADRIVICESGIHDHAQVKELSRFAQGFLVGSSLMAEADLELACRKLILGHNKVCGLTRPEDAHAAYAAGAVYGGLIFVGKSPRYVDLTAARLVMAGAPLQYVGVFRNAKPETVSQTASKLGLAAVQLHGEESADYIEQLRESLPAGCQIWKAVPVADRLPALDSPADRLLLDTRVGECSGGTGQRFDWSLLAGLDKHRLLLAGGLNPDNVQEAGRCGCLGLDLNSGVESAPGIKDATKIRLAFAAIRTY